VQRLPWPKCRRFVTALCPGDAGAKLKPSLEVRLKEAAFLHTTERWAEPERIVAELPSAPGVGERVCGSQMGHTVWKAVGTCH